WKTIIKAFFRKVLIYGSIMVVSGIAAAELIYPALSGVIPENYAKLIGIGFVFLVVIIFTGPLLDFHSVTFTHLWMSRKANRPPLVMLIMIKIAVIVFAVYITMSRLYGLPNYVFFITVILLLVLLGRSDFISTYYLQLETRFLRNLNDRTIDRSGEDKHQWLDEDFCIFSFVISPESAYAGRKLESINLGRNQNIYVVKIKKANGRLIVMPRFDAVLDGGDKAYVVGEKKKLETFYRTIKTTEKHPIRTLKEFMETDYPDTEHALACLAIKVTGREPYAGKPIRISGILGKRECVILGIEKEGMAITMPDANLLIEKGDIMWVIGSNNNVGRLAALSTVTEEHGAPDEPDFPDSQDAADESEMPDEPAE
ncbi:MAG: TrkA C-terminal domain-containing protein, partial [Eubacterium sp.]|nr:TrkA C-terminal domain-containing protein [Eubacterium sp.]